MPARILIIEDNQTNVELMVYLLGAFGYAAETAFNGKEGLQKVLQQRPDLIICDLQMPEMDGYEVAQKLKNMNDSMVQGIPLVAVTAYAMVGDRDRILASGFQGYIAKPISPETFVREVEAYLPAELLAGQTLQVVEAAIPPAVAARQQKRASILVLDDSPVNLSLIQSTLEPSGYHVIAAKSVPEAMERATRTSCDLILSDLHLPGQSGLDFLRQVKADLQLCSIPFVVITGSSSEPSGEIDLEETALASGATLFLRRPIEPQILLSTIDRVLAKTTRI